MKWIPHHEDMRVSTLLAAVLSASLILLASSQAAFIPTEVKKTVAFVFVPGKDGKPVANGTAFFIAVANQTNPNRVHNYLVTARHVLTAKDGKPYPKVWLRVNPMEGDAKLLDFDLKGAVDEGYFSTHPDETVDLAVVAIEPDYELFDIKALPEDILVTKQSLHDLNVHEGSDVFFTGLFRQFFGQKRNYPIARFGRVALLPDERIPFGGEGSKDPVPQELFLIESFAFGGNSGSPVFYYLGSDRIPGKLSAGTVIRLAGIMKGTFLDFWPLAMAETKTVPVSKDNVGIAAVIPSHLLHDILFSDALKERRASSQP